MLTRLVASEIDPDPELRDLLVSALLIGGNVTVAKGQDLGGDFENIPACRSESQTGCVVAYSAFSEPPPAHSFFGKVGSGPTGGGPATGDMEVLCVNPASLSEGTGTLQTEFATAPFPGTIGIWLKGIPSAATAWMSYPNRSTAHCESANDVNWLQVNASPDDTRPVVAAAPTAAWGLHLYDVTLALGNLVDLVRSQAEAYSQ